MKKILFILFIFLVSSIAYATQDVTFTKTGAGYVQKNGKSIEKFHYSLGTHSFPDGVTVIEVNDIAELDDIILYGKRYFDADKCKRDLFEEFKGNPQQLQTLIGIYSPISDFLDVKNFKGLREYAQILLNAGIVQPAIFIKLKQIIKQNHYDMDA